jgi:hypothetical protein
MIVFEEKLSDVVNLLPNHIDSESTEFVIKYGWGNLNELNKYITLNAQYPLIWLVDGEDTHNLKKDEVKRNARIVIATRSINVEEMNPFQYDNDFKLTLQPILDNLIKALILSGNSLINQETIKTTRMPNYGIEYRREYQQQTESYTLDIWNAIVLDAEITFTNFTTCLRQDIFNN